MSLAIYFILLCIIYIIKGEEDQDVHAKIRSMQDQMIKARSDGKAEEARKIQDEIKELVSFP